jgi:hypothetical protein
MPGAVRFNDHSFRRLIEKTMHSNILTRFGNIGLSRATYRRGRAGKVIAPVEKMLGIQTGATPAAADLVGRQIAATSRWLQKQMHRRNKSSPLCRRIDNRSNAGWKRSSVY